jgi:hypothetical protein
MTFLPFIILVLDSPNLESPAGALLETFPAMAGTPIFAQPPHPRNRQFGRACLPEDSYLKRAASEIPQRQIV